MIPLRSAVGFDGVEATKAPLRSFLTGNPFGHPFTQGFFYREKMRAIHRVAPVRPLATILEIGGGRGGLTGLLFPRSRIVNYDLDRSFASAPCNRRQAVHFLCGDATALPFPDASFDAVTMFDVLEHIPDDARAVAEAVRVLRPAGFLLVSTPRDDWRFPYYALFRAVCPTEQEMWEEWGHVRRGYSLDQLRQLIPLRCTVWATFITPITVLCHDIAFSRLHASVRQLLCTLLSPLTWMSYLLHRPTARGTETASAWQRHY